MEPAKASLSELLSRLQAIDDDMAPEDFDPATIVGDIKEKVDAIKWRIDQWKAKAAAIEQEWLIPLDRKREAILGKIGRLQEYVTQQMLTHNFETLPGEMFRIDLRRTSSLDAGEPTPEIMLSYPDLVRQKISYQWDTKLVKDRLAVGEQIPFCRLVNNQHIRFYTKKG